MFSPHDEHHDCPVTEVTQLCNAIVSNPIKSAGIYASHRFRGAFVGKVFKNWNFMDKFSSFLALDFSKSLQSPAQNFKLKFELEKKKYNKIKIEK